MSNNDTNTDYEDMREPGQSLIEACVGYRHDVALAALMGTVTYWMSDMCSECRKDFARTLKRQIPEMLATANRTAAMQGERADCQTHH